MMRWLFPWFIFCLFLCSCGRPQQDTPQPLQPPPADEQFSCRDIFPQGAWQFVHAIDFAFAGGNRGSALGIVVVDEQELRCALTTVEGVTLFEAVSRRGLPVAVSRALPPFNRPGFAEGLLRDVQTIFQEPQGSETHGALNDSTRVCRFARADGKGQTVDILQQKTGCWAMNIYDGGKLTRRVDASLCSAAGPLLLPKTIKLRAYGAGSYTLTMQLISAQDVSTGT